MTGKLNYAEEGMAAKAARVPFLIDRRKRLKIAVNPRKQRVEAISNRMKIRGSSGRENRAVRRAGILFTLPALSLGGSLEGPAVLAFPARTPFVTPINPRPSAAFTTVQQFCNCFQTQILIRIRSGPLQEFTRFEEEQ
jgi:hypothetical protein